MDYKIGFQIHRAISKHKLFCKCSTSYKNYKLTHKLVLPANLRRTTYKTHKYYYSPKTCGYEIDELPPTLNLQVIKKGIDIAKYFGFVLDDYYIVSRKYILDGSISCGFQKTGRLGQNAVLTYNDNSKILLTEIHLEEDSCTRHKGEWLVKRQGSALVQIVSEPIKLDLNALDSYVTIVLAIGHKLREFNIPRGKGFIRQDINLDFGFGKVELKGIQDPFNLKEIILKQYERTKLLNELITTIVLTKCFINKQLYKIILPNSNYILLILPDLLNLLKYEGYLTTQTEVLSKIHIVFNTHPDFAFALLKDFLIKTKLKDFQCTRAVKKDLTSILIRKRQLSDRIHVETDLQPYKIIKTGVIKLAKINKVTSELENKILNSLQKLGLMKKSLTKQIVLALDTKLITRYQYDELIKDILFSKGKVKVLELVSNVKYTELSNQDLQTLNQTIQLNKLYFFVIGNLRYKIYDFDKTKNLVNEFIMNHK